MYKDQLFLCIIPARGGSKGIPNKNIFEVNGKPLIQYTIDTALKSKYLDKVVVSTDSQIIAEIAEELGALVPFLRPQSIATDTSKTIDTVIHVIEGLEKYGERYNYIVLLQPTQPLRMATHIDEAIERIVASKESSLTSVTRVKENPVLIRTIDDNGVLKSIMNINSSIRRQDFKEYYKVNGSIYINRVDEQLTIETSLNDNILPFIMDSKYDLDIDEPVDMDLFKQLMDK